MAVRSSNSKSKPFTLSLIFLSLTFLLLTHTFKPKPYRKKSPERKIHSAIINQRWYNIVKDEIKSENIKIGLVNTNMYEAEQVQGPALSNAERDDGGIDTDMITVNFDRVARNLKWEDFFPEWIDEDEKFETPKCPEIPMPRFERYEKLDVIVARLPCGKNVTERESVRDLFRLQVNLVVANLLVRSDRRVYVVFIGSWGPMWEIFRCDDMLWHEGEYWVYKPDIRRLKEKVSMPVGTCKLATPFSKTGQDVEKSIGGAIHQPREAYVTVLHSSEAYLCGAISLAQSIIQTNSTKELVLLADNSISINSLQGLKEAGWKIKRIERIRSPHAKRGAYNEWNYSKLRIWELTEYDKVIFIDSDLIVLNNIDKFFDYPQLSAVSNDKSRFNSGLFMVEPSECTFKTLMERRFEMGSYNGGDQGFLNEAFTWWHRWPVRLNRLKLFGNVRDTKPDLFEDVYGIHYLGIKPWMCYEDYDCNWDMLDHHIFASDYAHKKWWRVYKGMPEKLRQYCGLSEQWEERIRKWRKIAKYAGLPNGHWKLKVNDPRSRQDHS